MRLLALRFISDLFNYNNELNDIEATNIDFDILEFKLDPWFDFTPSGVSVDLKFELENVYNLCQ